MAARWWVLMVTGFATVLGTHSFLVYWADKIASTTGYLVALGLIPVVFGLALGAGGAALAAKIEGARTTDLIVIPAACATAALLPVGWTLLMMS